MKFSDGYIKNLQEVTNDYTNCVMIDKSKLSVLHDEENSFIIKRYKGEDNDQELLKYQDILCEFVKEKKDFRDLIA